MARTTALPESSSFLLDVIRLAAALLVVVAHLSRPEIAVVQTRDLQFLGDLAVPLFFVLSGFVIRFVTVSREHTLRVYMIDRASRIYSVALPAMALTIAVASLCYVGNRTYFEQQIAPFTNHALMRVALNLSFLSQSWGLSTVQFANSPFWSLSYECPFYVAYGFLFYLRGTARVISLGLLALVVGPQVLFLFPIWLLGCGVYDLYQAVRDMPVAGILRRVALISLALAVTLALFGHKGLLLGPMIAQHAIAALPNPLELVHQNIIRATMVAVANGTLAAVGMFLILLLSDLVPLRKDQAFARRFRRLADGTFVIYLMHEPLMMFARSKGLLRANAPALDCLTMTTVVLLLIATATPLDALKRNLRRSLGMVRLPVGSSGKRTVQPLREPESLLR